ncbi:MAG: YraN family protein [Muribaculaceae bacterium]|nr:YraN family protein [Muribaculaceae bacterium]
MHSDKRSLGKQNREWGQIAESIAADYFLTQGYTIRERNWKSGKFEIDLILQKGREIIFVEVKARNGQGEDPADAVNYKKRRRIILAADYYLTMLPQLYEYRFDIVTITGTQESYKFEHYPDAFIPTVIK